MGCKRKLGALLLAAALAVNLAIPAAAAGSLPFTDVDSGQWYYSYVQDLYDGGIVDGVSSTLYRPQGTVTLGQALKLVLIASGYGSQAPTGSHWASGYYDLAQREGLLPDGLDLGLDEAIPRLAIGQIIVRAMDLSRITQEPSPFDDTDDEAALILWDHGIFEGTDVGEEVLFRPQSNISRAEIAAVIYRIYHYEPPEDPGQEEDGEYFYFNGKKVYVVEEMPERTYDSDLFQVDENGFLTYNSDEYTCRVGIDVSRYQGEIDWAAVKEAGVEFAMLRLGYRGYGTGRIVTDTYFETNLKGALENGIDVGVYFFSQAINEAEAVEEAQYCMDLLEGWDIAYPIVFDWEPYDSSLNPRTEGLSDEMLTKCAVAFCQAVEAGGYESMVYSNLTYFYLHYDLSQLVGFPLWLAQYNETPTFYYHFDMWQYSSTGTVPGIQGNVDLNIEFIPKT